MDIVKVSKNLHTTVRLRLIYSSKTIGAFYVRKNLWILRHLHVKIDCLTGALIHVAHVCTYRTINRIESFYGVTSGQDSGDLKFSA
jgi:hypothetical protein